MSASSEIGLYLVTFNCARTLIKAEAFASHFFDGLPKSASPAKPPDLIVLNLQEIVPLADGFRGYNLAQYYDQFEAAIHLAVKQRFADVNGDSNGGNDYTKYAVNNVGLTSIILFVRNAVQPRIKNLMSAGVGVGMQKMGNKGAAALRISWRILPSESRADTRSDNTVNLTFVSAHLAPMEEAVERRDQDFHDIVAGLVFAGQPSNDQVSIADSQSASRQTTEEQQPLLSPESTSASRLVGMYSSDTHLFFSGDLNYRTSSTRPLTNGSDIKSFPQPASSPSDPRHWSHLLAKDQLTQRRRVGKTLHSLTEAPITFPPTYKYSSAACSGKDIMLDSDVQEWKWSTHRWPSWCDRILFAPTPSSDTEIKIGNYTSLPLLATSDHRPVALSASIPLHPVANPDLAAHQPVSLDPHWKANRESAMFKEAVVGTVWSSVSTTNGLLSLTMGVSAVVCFVVFATIYSREW